MDHTNSFRASVIAGKCPTIPALAEHLGMSRNALYQAVQRGEIQASRIGRRVIVPAHVAARLLGLEDAVAHKPAEAA